MRDEKLAVTLQYLAKKESSASLMHQYQGDALHESKYGVFFVRIFLYSD